MFLDLVHRLNSAKQNLGPDLTETIGSYNIPANLMTRRKSLPQVIIYVAFIYSRAYAQCESPITCN